MLAQEPHLQLVATEYFANHQVIGSVVAKLAGATRQFMALADHNLVPVDQARELHRNILAPATRALDLRSLSDVCGWCDAHAAKKLNTLGDRVNQFGLFGEMFVEQQMGLIERRADEVGVRFFVESTQGHSGP